MRRKTISIVGAAVVGVALLAFLSAVSVLANPEPVTLNGEIEAAEEDDDGKVSSVLVFDSEWGEVLISREGKGAELLSHVGSIAEITGIIVELSDDVGNAYEIKVTSYTIEAPPGPDDPE